MTFGRTKKEIFAGLIEQVQRRLSSWNGLLLSPAGRLTLISSVLSNLSIYFLSVFRIPVSVAKKINSLLTQFWWNGPKGGKAIHWCSKLFLGMPKKQGGLGVRNIGCLNQALLAKQAWKILKEPESLLGRVFSSRYKLSIDSYTYVLENPPYNSSWGWNGIRWGLKLIDKNIAWKIGKPTFLRTWEVNWVDGSIPCRKENNHSTSHDTAHDENGDYVSDLITTNYKWDTEAIRNLVNEEWGNKIMAVPIPINGTNDSFYWNGSYTGDYTVKSGYQMALQGVFEEKGRCKDKVRTAYYEYEGKRCNLWSLPGPAKWALFIWKIITAVLPIGEEFLKRGMGDNHHCQVCGNVEIIETQEHLFRDCPIAERFWATTDLGIRSGVGRESSLKSWVINWISFLNKKDSTKESTILFLAALWTLWCNRNDIIFKHSDLSFERLFNFYRDAVLIAKIGLKNEGKRKNDSSGVRNDELIRIRHHYPHQLVGSGATCQPMRFKIDAAWDKDGKAGVGWVGIDALGTITFEGSKKGRAQSALQAEIIAIRDVLRWATHQRILHVWFSSDCLQAITQIAGISAQHHQLKTIIQEIYSLSAYFHCCSFSFIPRSLNRRAHDLAKKAKLMYS